jgi:hypothetical protein
MEFQDSDAEGKLWLLDTGCWMLERRFKMEEGRSE